MADQRYVDYIRANKDKHPLEALQQVLRNAGASPADLEEATRLALLPPAPAFAPPLAPPAAAAPAPNVSGGAPSAADQGVIATARAVLLEPDSFFRSMPRTGRWEQPLIFAGVMAVVSLVLRLAAAAVFSHAGLGAFVIGGIFGFIGGLIMIPVGFAIGAAVAHVIWMLMGSKQGFETSVQFLAFMTVVLPLQAAVRAVPGVGVWLAIPVSLYGVYLYVPASIEAHGIEKSKARTVAGVFACLAFLAMVGSAIAAWKLRRVVASLGQPAAALQLLGKGAGQNGAQQAALLQLMGNLAQNRGAAAGQSSAPNVSNPAAMAAAIQTLAGGANANVKAVDPQLLKTLLPAQLAGLPRKSDQSNVPAPGAAQAAWASGIYEDGSGKRIEIKLTDAAGYSGLLTMAWGAASMTDYNQETQVRIARSSQYKSYRLVEEYDKVNKYGSLRLIDAQRFIVEVRGNNADLTDMRSALDAVDLDALGRLGR